MAGTGVEVGKAYVTIVPVAKNFGKILEGVAVPAAEEAGQKSSEKYKEKITSPTVAQRIGAGLKSSLGAVAAGVGMHVGQLMARAMSGGFERLESIDAASAKLRGLGMDASTSSEVMANALASVKGTAFGMGEAATTAAGAVAAGIQPGAQLEQVLKNVANAAAATDSSMGDMGAIFNKVATTNKATNESLLQVADRGLPIYQALADQLGVTTSEVEDMASKGQINFQQFSDAAAAAAGTVASEMGNTATGSMTNFFASLSRFGAAALGGVFEGIGPAFKEFTTWVDGATESVKPFAQQFGQDLVEKGRNAIAWIKSDAIPAIGRIKDTLVAAYDWVQSNREWLEPIAVGILAAVAAWKAYAITMAVVKGVQAAFTAVQAALNVVMAANPIGIVVLALTGLVAGLVYAYKHSETFRNVVDAAFAKVREVAGAVADWFTNTAVPALGAAWDAIKGFFAAGAEKIGSIVEAVKGFFTGVGDAFRAVGDWIVGAWDWITARFQQAVDWLGEVFAAAWGVVESYIVDPFMRAVNWVQSGWDWITDKFNLAWTAISTWVQTTWSTLTGMLGSVIDAAKTWIDTAWNNIINGVNTFWQNIVGWVQNTWSTLTGMLSGPIETARGWIDTALNGIRSGFDAAVNFIRDTWEQITEAVKKPIRFVMTTVIDNGLIAGFNKIADFANSPRISPITPPGFASGGYVDLPWSAAHRDPYLGQTTAGRVFRFEGEEFIVNRDATRRNRGLLEAINSGQVQGFAEGGFLGEIGSLLTDPRGYLGGLVDRLLGGVDDSVFLRTLIGVPRRIVTMITEWVESKISSLFSTGDVGAGVERWRSTAIQAMQLAGLPMQYLPLLMHRMQVESGGNPMAINLWDSNAAAGIPSKGLMQTIDPTFYAYAGPFAPLGPYNPLANIYAAIRYTLARYGLGGIQRAWGGTAGYASGTMSARRGLAWVGEQGPELVNFRGGERVWSHRESMGMLPGRVTLVATDGTMLGVFRAVAADVVAEATAAASPAALTSRFGGM